MRACKSYGSAMRGNLLAGGDNCSRAVIIGALFAAQVRLELGAGESRCALHMTAATMI